MYFIKPFKRPIIHTVCDTREVNGDYEQRQTISLRNLKLFLVALMLAAYDAMEISYFFYAPSMLQGFSYDASEAAYIVAILSLFYTVGRFFTAFISLKLRPYIILAYHFFIITLAQILLYYYYDNKTMTYISHAILGND